MNKEEMMGICSQVKYEDFTLEQIYAISKKLPAKFTLGDINNSVEYVQSKYGSNNSCARGITFVSIIAKKGSISDIKHEHKRRLPEVIELRKKEID